MKLLEWWQQAGAKAAWLSSDLRAELSVDTEVLINALAPDLREIASALLLCQKTDYSLALERLNAHAFTDEFNGLASLLKARFYAQAGDFSNAGVELENAKNLSADARIMAEVGLLLSQDLDLADEVLENRTLCECEEWQRVLGDTCSFLPRDLQSQIRDKISTVSWLTDGGIVAMLCIVLDMKQREYPSALKLIEETYPQSSSKGHLFLLRARVHHALDEFDEMLLCLEGAAELCDDVDMFQGAFDELSANTISRFEVTHTVDIPSQKIFEFKGVNLLLISPLSYDYSECLRPIIDNLECELTAAGYNVLTSENEVRAGFVNVVVGWHLVAPDELWSFPSNTIFYNFEQMDEKNRHLKELFNQLSHKYECWDYSQKNIDIVGTHRVRLIEYKTTTFSIDCDSTSSREKTIDVLFYGSVNGRRRDLIEQLISRGLKVKVLTKSFGEELNAWIRKSKIVLNIHFYELAILEVTRINYVLGKGVAIVSEYQGSIPENFEGSVKFAKYEDLCSVCCELLNDDVGQRVLIKKSFEYLLKNLARFDFRNSDYFHNSAIAKVGRLSRKPRATIIIPVFNNLHLTKQCIESLKTLTDDTAFQIIVVDDASDSDTSEYLLSLTLPITVIRNEANCGYLRSCNKAFRQVRTEYTILLNNDTIVRDGWLDEMVKVVDRDSNIGAVGSVLFYETGVLQELGSLVFSDGSGWNFGKGSRSLNLKIYDEVIPVDYCSAASLLVRTALIRLIGGFDERFVPAYYEDTDLCFSIREKGFEVVCATKSRLIHLEGATSGTDSSVGPKANQVTNQPKFCQKWAKELSEHRRPPESRDEFPKSPNRNLEHGFVIDQSIVNPRQVRLGTEGSVQADNESTDIRHLKFPLAGLKILIVEKFLPFFDRASGSLRTFNIVEILSNLGAEVVFLARNPSGCERYAQPLLDMGVTLLAGDANKMAREGFKVNYPAVHLSKLLDEQRFDFAYIFFFDLAEQYLHEIKQLSPETTVIIDSVDLHFLREIRQFGVSGDSDVLRRALITQMRELYIYRQADRVIYLSTAEAAYVRGLGVRSPASIIPNIHKIESGQLTLGERKRDNLIFIGNFNHPPNCDAILWFVDEIWPLILNAQPQVKLLVAGNNPPADIQKLGLIKAVKVLGYVQDLDDLVGSSVLSIAPLRYGAGMKGKVGQSLALGTPVVTSPVGIEGYDPEINEIACVCETPSEYVEAISSLLEFEDIWTARSKQGVVFMQKHFSPSVLNDVIANVFKGEKKNDFS